MKEILYLTEKPIVVNFSGGKDSMSMLGLVLEITENVIPFYMKTGIDFPEAVDFARESASKLGKELVISEPSDHLGGFFDRIVHFGFPNLQATWCNRDLKVRPQMKVLNREFGRGVYYKMVGVRKYESSRRKKMHRANRPIVEDYNTGRDFLVYPILQWTSRDVARYLREKGLPTSGLYKKYGVSGCYWCPYYQASIYRAVLKDFPHLYDEFIEWEERLDKPSVNGHIWLRDLARENY